MIKHIEKDQDNLGWYALLKAIDDLYYLQSRGLFNTPKSLKERRYTNKKNKGERKCQNYQMKN